MPNRGPPQVSGGRDRRPSTTTEVYPKEPVRKLSDGPVVSSSSPFLSRVRGVSG